MEYSFELDGFRPGPGLHETRMVGPLLLRRQRRHTLLVLLGIDGSGKTTAAGTLKDLLPSTPVLVLGNYSGRKTIAGWALRYRLPVPDRIADGLETAVRVFNVLINHVRASRFDGLVIMDRHLYCQLALRNARGMRRGTVLPALAGILPRPYAVVYFDIPPAQAYERIRLRGEDQETIDGLLRLQSGYRELPCFPSFRAIDASGSRESTLLQLLSIITPMIPEGARAKANSA